MKKTLLLSFAIMVALQFTPKTNFGQSPDLGTASSFAVFTAGGAFTNDGATHVKGDIGTDVGVFTGFPIPGTVDGQIHVADPASTQAKIDVGVAYSYLFGLTCGQVLGTSLGSNQTLTPKVYCLGAASTLIGDLILDGQGDPNAMFVFQINGSLTTVPFSNVKVINSACLCNVYWQVNGEFILGESSVFRGNLVGNGAVNLLEGSSLLGRALTNSGAVAMHNNNVSIIAPVLTTTDIRYNRAVLNWADFCPGAINYRVYWRNQAEPTAAGALNEVVTGATTSLLIEKIPASSTFYWKIQAEYASGWETYSDSVSFATPMPTLTNSEITFNKAKFSWTAVAGATGYRIKYITGSIIKVTPTIINTDTVISNLLANSLYKWQIGAIYAPGEYIGATPPALAAQFTTSAAPVKTASPINFNRAVLNWDAVPGAVSYLIKFKTGASFAVKTTTNASITLNGLKAGTTYTWMIMPDYGNGWTSYTPSGSFTTSAEPVLTTNPLNFNQATLNWDVIPGATKYKIVFYYGGGSLWTTRNTTNTSFTFTNLNSSTAYSWKVMPDYGAGWTSYTSLSSFNTPAPKLMNSELSNAEESGELNIFPNPASEVLFIKYKVQSTEQVAIYAIYNSIGEMVLNGTVSQEQFRINISDYSKGIYFLKVIDGTETKVQKIMVE